MENVGFCGVVFLSSHLDQKLGIFVQTFGKITIEIGRASFAQHMADPSRALEVRRHYDANADCDEYQGMPDPRNNNGETTR